MLKVFVSSVVQGFEEFRAAARAAINLMGHRPIMVEDFGARPYSSEKACVTEVEQSDAYIVILGERYGFVTDSGISVTHAEFNTARATQRPMLAFLQKCEMEAQQKKFAKQVEEYAGGSFRASFTDPHALKDEIVRGLRNLEQQFQATPKDVFEHRVKAAIDELNGSRRRHEAELIIAFWPQPVRSVDVIGLEHQLDAHFSALATAGLVVLRDGYEAERAPTWTGLRSKKTRCIWFDDGLQLFLCSPRVEEDKGWSFAGYYSPPSVLESRLMSARQAVSMNGGWCYVALRGMESVRVEEFPRHQTNSISMRMYGKEEDEAFELIIPLTDARYGEWVKRTIGRFKRTFS